MRQGTAIKLDFVAVKSTVASNAATSLTREASFGPLDPGNYTFSITTRGLTVATKTFTVPSPAPIAQNVILAAFRTCLGSGKHGYYGVSRI